MLCCCRQVDLVDPWSHQSCLLAQLQSYHRSQAGPSGARQPASPRIVYHSRSKRKAALVEKAIQGARAMVYV